MTTYDVRDAPVPFAVAADSTESNLVAVLRRASVTIDHLWRNALHEGMGEAAVKLGEASQGVHRALIALSPINTPAA